MACSCSVALFYLCATEGIFDDEMNSFGGASTCIQLGPLCSVLASTKMIRRTCADSNIVPYVQFVPTQAFPYLVRIFAGRRQLLQLQSMSMFVRTHFP